MEQPNGKGLKLKVNDNMHVDISQVRLDWSSRGFSCDTWTDPPGRRWENYSHASDELFMVLEGKVELELDSKKWCPKKGDEVFIPARAIHSVRNRGTTTSRWLYGYKSNSFP